MKSRQTVYIVSIEQSGLRRQFVTYTVKAAKKECERRFGRLTWHPAYQRVRAVQAEHEWVGEVDKSGRMWDGDQGTHLRVSIRPVAAIQD